MFDSMIVVLLIVDTLKCSLAHLYSISYMPGDLFSPWCMCYLFIPIFLCQCWWLEITHFNSSWDGKEYASYLLMNFWFTWLLADKVAMKVMPVNWGGDFGLEYENSSFLLILIWVLWSSSSKFVIPSELWVL